VRALRPRMRRPGALLALCLALFVGTIGLAWISCFLAALCYMPRG